MGAVIRASSRCGISPPGIGVSGPDGVLQFPWYYHFDTSGEDLDISRTRRCISEISVGHPRFPRVLNSASHTPPITIRDRLSNTRSRRPPVRTSGKLEQAMAAVPSPQSTASCQYARHPTTDQEDGGYIHVGRGQAGAFTMRPTTDEDFVSIHCYVPFNELAKAMIPYR